MSYGRHDDQIVKEFRSVARSFAETFRITKDHVRALLESTQNYHSGLFREGLLRTFLSDVLPRAVSVSGFIYGFGRGCLKGAADKLLFPPILKCLVTYESPADVRTVLPTIAEFYAAKMIGLDNRLLPNLDRCPRSRRTRIAAAVLPDAQQCRATRIP